MHPTDLVERSTVCGAINRLVQENAFLARAASEMEEWLRAGAVSNDEAIDFLSQIEEGGMKARRRAEETFAAIRDKTGLQ